MFIPLEAPAPSLQSKDSKISPNDWAVLSRFWYPLARVSAIGDQPVALRLLDVELVAYRSAGAISVVHDRCPHRWMRLSGGTLQHGRLTCRFHGLAFDAAGQCVHVPALGTETRVPASYRVRTFRTRERHGLLWVCLDDDSTEGLPDFPALAGLDDSALMYGNVCEWPMSSARQIENFIDLAHLPWVHASTLGGDPHGRIQPARIEQRDASLLLEARFVETVPFDGTPTECELRYEVFPPFAVNFTSCPVGSTGFSSVNIASPVSAHTCRVFQIIARGAPGEVFADGPLDLAAPEDGPGVINQQDIDVHGLLAEHDLPLHEKLEIHLPVDNAGMAYRRRLRALGLGR